MTPTMQRLFVRDGRRQENPTRKLLRAHATRDRLENVAINRRFFIWLLYTDPEENILITYTHRKVVVIVGSIIFL